jgi:hypothetical protein
MECPACSPAIFVCHQPNRGGNMNQPSLHNAMQPALDFGIEVQKPMHPVKRNKAQELAKAWVKYAHTNQIKPNTKGYKWAQHAFLAGAGNALGEDMPMLLSLCLASGRDVVSIIESSQPR